jgi:threonylcarbamoyladenosine tRNA methylthiotransferase MtaB
LLRNAKHSNPSIKTIITGCVAQIEKEKLLELDYVDFVFGNDDKFKIAEYLTKNEKTVVSDIMQVEEFNYQVLNDTTKTRLSLKIQDGCNNRCAYCIIPFARGKSRSADSDFIVEQINNATNIGFKEVIFTGIHIGQWKVENGQTIVDLLKEVEEKTNIPRYRLGSLNPLEITPELLDFLEHSEKFCPHFHLSLQSACNKTLKSMNRFYTVEKYLDQIEDINSRFDKPFLGSDIIAGFVGEDDKDFEITVENLKKSKLTQIHTFPYSIRKGTQAENMQGHLPDKVKQERAEIIKSISRQKYMEFLNSNLGDVREVLIEKHPDKHLNKLKGITRNYLNVVIENIDTDFERYHNNLFSAQLTTLNQTTLSGKLIF